MAKISAKLLFKKVLLKLLSPKSLRHLITLSINKKKIKRPRIDVTLKLFSKILPGDFLHYGYFEDVNRSPEDISMSDMAQAQVDYARLLISKMKDKDSPVLDVGCGMGGLIGLLLMQGFAPVALTPDRYQIDYVQKKYPKTEILDTKFEHMPLEKYKSHFGTVIMSESLQYQKIERSLQVVDTVLAPGGTWIVSDYFKKRKTRLVSGFFWEAFNDQIERAGWKISYSLDITPNTLPFLKFILMWSRRLLIPLMELALDNFRNSRPGIYYLVEEVIEPLKDDLNKKTDYVDPEAFARDKKYMLLVLERI
ncbi:MAG TPA: methyltransferase domain-containing protein [Spirochaetes bacterium]|nr:methyltransferase domain-containing protein [Spirochaetota bacterium]